jgi:putative intracellular protease/amidase
VCLLAPLNRGRRHPSNAKVTRWGSGKKPTYNGPPRDHRHGPFQGFTALDAIGPYEVLTYLPGAEVVFCAEQTGVVDDHNDLVHLRVDTTFDDVPRPDVLFVPGGPVRRRRAPDRRLDPPGTPPHQWTTSVCTGALLLGAAGLLNGPPATTHWSAYDELASYGR